jgi:hypothetical protein
MRMCECVCVYAFMCLPVCLCICEPQESVLGSSPDEDGFCSLKTKHKRRTAPTPKLYVSAWRLQKQRSQNPRIVLGSSPGEYDVCTLKTYGDKRR